MDKPQAPFYDLWKGTIWKISFFRTWDMNMNVGLEERWISIAGGAYVALKALRKSGVMAIGLLLAGMYLLYRGLYGHCLIYEILQINTAPSSRASQKMRKYDNKPPPEIEKSDQVLEASYESFPASDPPAW